LKSASTQKTKILLNALTEDVKIMIDIANYKNMSSKEAKKIKKLREIIKTSKIPEKKIDSNLLITTFNIREFGAKRRKNFAINALAEICSNFDIIAIQELRTDLNDLKRMLEVLGPYWKVIFNDPSGAPKRPGNDERLAFLYDNRVVRFTGMAAELMISDDFLGSAGVPKTDMSVPWRTPYMVSFRAGTFDFMLLTVHIQWNKSGGISARAKEIEMITNWVGKRKKESRLYDPDIFVLGDFNIPGLKSKTFKALKQHGLEVPKKLQMFKTNLKKTAHYDQIAYYKENTDCEIGEAGIIDFYDAFFTQAMSDSQYEKMTYQISDHLPFWAEFKILESDLDQFINQ
jgi:endonuclease/exonuclease/phosphatase family metal-dependent hydrolase